MDSSKILGYAVLTSVSEDISKLVAYAVLAVAAAPPSTAFAAGMGQANAVSRVRRAVTGTAAATSSALGRSSGLIRLRQSLVSIVAA
jgi:hypothetical protein